MLFRSNVTHKLDPKSRVAVPASWRAAFDSTLIMLDARNEGYPVVKCYTEASFAAQIDFIRQDAERAGATPKAIARYVGDIIGRSYEAEVSSQGKLLIPKKQRERLRLAAEATLVGRGDYFEIWLPEDFDTASEPEGDVLDLDNRYGMLN